MAAVRLEDPKAEAKPRPSMSKFRVPKKRKMMKRNERKNMKRRQRMVDALVVELEEMEISGGRERKRREKERLFLLQGVGEEDGDLEVVREEAVYDEREEFGAFGEE